MISRVDKWIFHAALALACLLGCYSLGAQTSTIPYLHYCENTAQFYLNNLDSLRRIWQSQDAINSRGEYSPVEHDIYLAALCANMFEITGKAQYLERVPELLSEYGRYKSGFSSDRSEAREEFRNGLPAVPSFFALPKFVHAYAVLSRHRKVDKAISAVIEELIAESADFMLTTQEWGPMNRAMLRAEGLLYAVRELKDHTRRPVWESAGSTILKDNLSNWSIEDSGMYQIIWLYSLAGYCTYVSEDFHSMKTPVIRYYFDYFKALLSPAGVIPDFGDAHWGSRWFNYVAHFELGASINEDPELRWAAETVYLKNKDKNPHSLLAALVLSDACRWGDFTVGKKMPVSGSQEVLEDQIGKKIVFRNGWESNDTYLLLNYKDEGEHGWMYKENLKTTLTVEEEKMHHGHSDENSIVLLMDDQSVLLHDGGYRTLLPSGTLGAYRADYFHNRLVVRNRKIDTGQKQGDFKYNTRDRVTGQSLLSFLAHSGAYQQVKTYKVEFSKFRDCEISRSRIVNKESGYEADRIINYLKPLNIFVIFDVIRYLNDGYYTSVNLWHGRKILDRGLQWFDIQYDSLNLEKLPGNKRLWIYFPDNTHGEIGTERTSRYYQTEQLIYQFRSRHAYPQRLDVFTTVLIPHDPDESFTSWMSNINISVDTRTVTCTIERDSTVHIIGAKTDLASDYVREWSRPKYDWESGKQYFSDFSTDASHFYAGIRGDECHVAGTNLTRILYKQIPLFEQAPVTNDFRFDGNPPEAAAWKVRSWQGTAKLRD